MFVLNIASPERTEKTRNTIHNQVGKSLLASKMRVSKSLYYHSVLIGVAGSKWVSGIAGLRENCGLVNEVKERREEVEYERKDKLKRKKWHTHQRHE